MIQTDAAIALDRTERLQEWQMSHEEIHRLEREALLKRLNDIETRVNSISVKFLILVTCLTVIGESLLRAGFSYLSAHLP